MKVWSIQFAGEIRVVDSELEEGESPVDAAQRLLGPVGVQIYDVEDTYEIEPTS